MNTLVLIVMMLIAFNFLLKQTFWKMPLRVVTAICSAVFVGLMWSIAIEQSRNQIDIWLNNPALMRDTSVILMIEIALQIAFCILTVKVNALNTPIKKITYSILYYFPGVLFFIVLFSALVFTLYSFPGESFQLVAWSFAGIVLVIMLLASWILKKILPDEDLRTELLFLTNLITIMAGIIVTVNGEVHVVGSDDLNWSALLFIILLSGIGATIGFVLKRNKLKKIDKNVKI